MTPLVMTYSIGFMRVPSEQSRYYFGMCIFAASMMLFSIAGDFITMLIGWELLGLASYLLIGFWYGKDKAPAAARKAITTVLDRRCAHDDRDADDMEPLPLLQLCSDNVCAPDPGGVAANAACADCRVHKISSVPLPRMAS